MDVHSPKNGINRYWPNPIWGSQKRKVCPSSLHRFVPAQAGIGLSGSTDKNPQRIVKGWEKHGKTGLCLTEGWERTPWGRMAQKSGLGSLANRFWEWEAPGFILSKGFQYSKLTRYPLKLLAVTVKGWLVSSFYPFLSPVWICSVSKKLAMYDSPDVTFSHCSDSNSSLCHRATFSKVLKVMISARTRIDSISSITCTATLHWSPRTKPLKALFMVKLSGAMSARSILARSSKVQVHRSDTALRPAL